MASVHFLPGLHDTVRGSDLEAPIEPGPEAQRLTPVRQAFDVFTVHEQRNVAARGLTCARIDDPVERVVADPEHSAKIFRDDLGGDIVDMFAAIPRRNARNVADERRHEVGQTALRARCVVEDAEIWQRSFLRQVENEERPQWRKHAHRNPPVALQRLMQRRFGIERALEYGDSGGGPRSTALRCQGLPFLTARAR